MPPNLKRVVELEYIEQLQLSMIRNLSVAERISRLRSLSGFVIHLSRRAIERANPGMNEKRLRYKIVEYHYGKDLAVRLQSYLEKGSS